MTVCFGQQRKKHPSDKAYWIVAASVRVVPRQASKPRYHQKTEQEEAQRGVFFIPKSSGRPPPTGLARIIGASQAPFSQSHQHRP